MVNFLWLLSINQSVSVYQSLGRHPFRLKTGYQLPGEEEIKTIVQPGLYRHYKGNLYEVIDVARHSETEEQLVVYRCLRDDNSLWVRPLAMFLESVEVAGQEIPRFARIEQ